MTDFEKETGCQVNVKIGNTSDEMVTLMRTGQYDGVSASGDATLRLIAGGDVAPVNTDLIPNYADVFDGLKNQPHNSVDGADVRRPARPRREPAACGARTRSSRRRTRWSVVFDPNSPYKGKVTAYDNPIYIADAALYLMTTQPDLGIKNPYELDDKQFQAAVDLLKQQREIIGEYWSRLHEGDQRPSRAATPCVGTTWQVIANLLDADKVPVKTDAAEGGRDRLVGHVDDLVQGQAPELHVHVDEPHHLAEGERRRGRVVRRGAVRTRSRAR